MKKVAKARLVRAFFAGAMVVAAVMNVASNMPPVGQLSASVVAGLASAALVKVGVAVFA